MKKSIVTAAALFAVLAFPAQAQKEFWDDPIFSNQRDPSFDTIIVGFCEETYEQDVIIVVSGRINFEEDSKNQSWDILQTFDQFPARENLLEWIKEYYGVSDPNQVYFNYKKFKTDC